MSELRRLRLDKGLSVSDLAGRSGVSDDQIRNIESGTSPNPRTGTLVKLAEALEVKPSEIDPVLNREAA